MPGLNDYHVDNLKEKGLKNPTEDLLSDLEKQENLIPFKGTLGGTMYFLRENALILNQKWIFAPFEDGHICGSLILEYRVKKNGKISWKVISSHLDN